MGDSLFEAILSECAFLSCRSGLTSVSPLGVCLTPHLPNKASDREANPIGGVRVYEATPWPKRSRL